MYEYNAYEFSDAYMNNRDNFYWTESGYVEFSEYEFYSDSHSDSHSDSSSEVFDDSSSEVSYDASSESSEYVCPVELKYHELCLDRDIPLEHKIDLILLDVPMDDNMRYQLLTRCNFDDDELYAYCVKYVCKSFTKPYGYYHDDCGDFLWSDEAIIAIANCDPVYSVDAYITDMLVRMFD